MAKCKLEEDKLVGHELFAEGLFKKKFLLRDVYYNELIGESSDKLDIEDYLKMIQRTNEYLHFSYRNGGHFMGKTKLERRIHQLQFNFVNSYVNEALALIKKN